MFRAFSDLAELLGLLVPARYLFPLIAALLLAATPLWARSIRIRQLRGAVRRRVRAEGDARRALRDEILARAGRNPHLLYAVAEQAIRYGQHDLRDEALARLEREGRRAEVAHLRARFTPERKPVGHPLEAVVAVERLLEQGMVDAARARVREALRRFPDDPELRALLDRTEHAS